MVTGMGRKKNEFRYKFMKNARSGEMMELKEAIERLTEVRDRYEKNIKILEENNAILKNTNFYEILGERRADFGAIDTVLKELHTLQMNYKLLEDKFDGSAEEKVDKLTEELETRYNKGYQDGFKQAKFDCEMDKLDGR